MGALSGLKVDRAAFWDGAFPPAPNYVDARVLAVSVAETVTIPTGANFVIFSATADFFARWDGSAAVVPAADVTDGTASERNPTQRYLRGLTSFSVISSGTPTITMAFYG